MTRDSGRHAKRENSRSEVEAEGCQSGGGKADASPILGLIFFTLLICTAIGL